MAACCPLLLKSGGAGWVVPLCVRSMGLLECGCCWDLCCCGAAGPGAGCERAQGRLAALLGALLEG